MKKKVLFIFVFTFIFLYLVQLVHVTFFDVAKEGYVYSCDKKMRVLIKVKKGLYDSNLEYIPYIGLVFFSFDELNHVVYIDKEGNEKFISSIDVKDDFMFDDYYLAPEVKSFILVDKITHKKEYHIRANSIEYL